jgi:hypothetical protein
MYTKKKSDLYVLLRFCVTKNMKFSETIEFCLLDFLAFLGFPDCFVVMSYGGALMLVLVNLCDEHVSLLGWIYKIMHRFRN